MGVLDARLLPVPRRGVSDCGIALVRCFRKRGAALHGGRGFHRVRHPLIRDGPSPLQRVKLCTWRMDGDRIFLHFGARNLGVWRGRRYSRHDYLHWSDVDLSRGSSNAAGRVERWLPNRCAAPMFDWNLADVLHPGGHRQSGIGLQTLSIGRSIRRTSMTTRIHCAAGDSQPHRKFSGCKSKAFGIASYVRQEHTPRKTVEIGRRLA
jgi:hypothetical protein